MKSTETILAEILKDLEHLKENQDKGFKHINEQQSNMIESYNGKFRMTDDRITRGCEKTTKLDERLTDAEKVQAVRVSNLTKVIAFIAIGSTLIAEKVWNFIFG